MQEVFEKIIGKLVNKRKTVEQLIMENPQDELDKIQTQAAEDFASAYGEAIEIVKQEAEKYNNGWIPCSERLPKVEDLHEKSLDNCTCYLIQRKCGIMDVAHYIKVYGEPYFAANSIKMIDVVAWKSLPAPYQTKGE